MRFCYRLATLLLAIIYCFGAVAQDNNYILEQLKNNTYVADTSAIALVLLEQGTVTVDTNEYGYTQVYHLHRIIKVLKDNGTIYADVKENYLTNQKVVDAVRNFNATTWNLKNGKAVATPVDRNAIRYGTVDKYNSSIGFTLPNVSVGSVIEYEFDLAGALHSLLPIWEFQNSVPKLLSEYEIVFPKSLQCTYSLDGYLELQFRNFRNENEARAAKVDQYFLTSDDGTKKHWKWGMKDLLPIKQEPFIAFADNYRPVLFAQISGRRPDHPDSLWRGLTRELWHSEHFGGVVTARDPEVKRLSDSLSTGINDTLEKGKAIFAYVRDHFENNNNPGFFSRRDMDQLIAHTNASEAEINLVLTSMLRNAGIDASPIILARLGGRRATHYQPSFTRFNYTICRAKIGGKSIFLDASNRFNTFGYPPIYCYNGYARVVDEKGDSVLLENTSVTDQTTITVKVNNVNQQTMLLQVEEKKGRIEANYLRNIFTSDTDMLNKYIRKSLGTTYPNLELLYSAAENVYDADKDLIVKYVVRVPANTEGEHILIPTDIMKLFAKNPFVAPARKLPVYFPSAFSWDYHLTLDLPEGKITNNVPNSYEGKMPGNELEYRHKVHENSNHTQLTVDTHIAINQPSIIPYGYANLKAFYQKMATEQNSIIALIPKP